MAVKWPWHRVWTGPGKQQIMEEKTQPAEAEIRDDAGFTAEADARKAEHASVEHAEREAQGELKDEPGGPEATVDGASNAQAGGAANMDSAGDKVSTPETDWQDKYLRLYAEFDNFRKRSMRERSDLIRNASRDVVDRLLPVLDDFERATKAEGDLASVREGMQLIHGKLMNTLGGQGLKPMEVQQGDDFDVEWHEAITRIPAPTPELVGKVVDVVEQGYHMNDTVLRYAKVVVGS